jgi:nucleoside-diphosphate-sugar epimerase
MKALVVGGSGTVGLAVAHGLSEIGEVIALSQTPPNIALPSAMQWLGADIGDPHNVRAALRGEDVDVLVYAAFAPDPASTPKPFHVAALRRLAHRVRRQSHWDAAQLARAAQITYALDTTGRNLHLFRTVVDTVRASQPGLRHVLLITGAKTYGVQWGPTFGDPWHMPLSEDSPRHPGPNWYFDVEDHAAALTQDGLPVTVIRPPYVLDEWGLGRLNLAQSLCLYLELQKLCGQPALFPGGIGSYRARWSMAPSSLIGRLAAWTVQRPDTWGQTFNVAASEAPPWSVLWPQLAALYGLPVAVPDQPLSVGRMMRADPAAAARLRALGYDLGGFTPIDFIDLAMVCDWDQVLSMRKAQDLGFDANADILRPIAGEQVRLRAALAAAAPACSRGQLA